MNSVIFSSASPATVRGSKSGSVTETTRTPWVSSLPLTIGPA
ncbi:MAG TPA: hypothetical protein VM221_04160 [Armatimonadota bacterium]|nr:hypothetical protein [Armatimonadota bacterium]